MIDKLLLLTSSPVTPISGMGPLVNGTRKYLLIEKPNTNCRFKMLTFDSMKVSRVFVIMGKQTEQQGS